MPKFVIEREVPGLGNMTAPELQALSQKSCDVLSGMGPDTQWVESYVTDNKLFCVYYASDEANIREHARRGGFPCNRIYQVGTMISPVTAEG